MLMSILPANKSVLMQHHTFQPLKLFYSHKLDLPKIEFLIQLTQILIFILIKCHHSVGKKKIATEVHKLLLDFYFFNTY